MADDPQAVRQTAQPSVHDLHSQPTTAASGGRELQLPREVPPAAANSPRNVPVCEEKCSFHMNHTAFYSFIQ